MKRAVISYIDVDTIKYQYRLINPTPLDCIAGYIIEDGIGDRDLKGLRQRRLNLIDGYISSYCYILNSPRRLNMINQANGLAYDFYCDAFPGNPM